MVGNLEDLMVSDFEPVRAAAEVITADAGEGDDEPEDGEPEEERQPKWMDRDRAISKAVRTQQSWKSTTLEKVTKSLAAVNEALKHAEPVKDLVKFEIAVAKSRMHALNLVAATGDKETAATKLREYIAAVKDREDRRELSDTAAAARASSSESGSIAGIRATLGDGPPRGTYPGGAPRGPRGAGTMRL
eukprot:2972947-Pyramimonas_sp.AAC.1